MPGFVRRELYVCLDFLANGFVRGGRRMETRMHLADEVLPTTSEVQGAIALHWTSAAPLPRDDLQLLDLTRAHGNHQVAAFVGWRPQLWLDAMHRVIRWSKQRDGIRTTAELDMVGRYELSFPGGIKGWLARRQRDRKSTRLNSSH